MLGFCLLINKISFRIWNMKVWQVSGWVQIQHCSLVVFQVTSGICLISNWSQDTRLLSPQTATFPPHTRWCAASACRWIFTASVMILDFYASCKSHNKEVLFDTWEGFGHYIWYSLLWARPLDNLHGLPGLQETGSERPGHQPQRLLFQPWSVCGRFERVEEAEDHQRAGEVDGGEFQVYSLN